MGIGDFIVLSVLALWLITAVCHTRKRKKSGKCIGCGGNCAGCPHHIK